jgi:hypothetical protein
MSNKFDELARSLAQSATRRQALKKFGLGLAGMALACFGISNTAAAGGSCQTNADCGNNQNCCGGTCVSRTDNNNCGTCGNVCPAGTQCQTDQYRPFGVKTGIKGYFCF